MSKAKSRLISAGAAVVLLVTALLFAFPAMSVKAWDGTVATSFSGGDGSEGKPYEISTAEQLAYFAQVINDGTEGNYATAYYKLTADIVLNNTLEGTPNEWTPINPNNTFTGTFDGNGKTVKGVYINKPEESFKGLFARNSGVIKNVGVVDCFISGSGNLGGVCGFNRGSISNCYVTGEVTGTVNAIGGVCGFNNSTVEYCYSSCKVNRDMGFGSVCGVNDNGTFRSCYYAKEICTAGGINNTDTEGQAEGLKLAELCSGVLPAGFSSDIWEAGECISSTTEGRKFSASYILPHFKGSSSTQTASIKLYNFDTTNSAEGDWQLYTEISTTAQLQDINTNRTTLAGYYVLVKDIDVTADNGTGENNFTPIGSGAYPFIGKFSGDGHTVSGININSSNNNQGLFGYSTGTICYVGVINSSITGSKYVGGVCGYNTGTVSGCYNTGSVSGSQNVGGVCGYNTGTVGGCYNTGSVSGTSSYVGGVCGDNTGTVGGCYNTGSVSGTSYYVGGVCGDNIGTVSGCYNTGSVSGTSYYVGGVCGYNTGTVGGCYNTGSVSGTNDNVGGVCGYNTDTGTVNDCYNTGSVSGTVISGGVCGNNTGTVTNCLYNKDFCTVGGICSSDKAGMAVGISTEELCTSSLNDLGFETSVWTQGSVNIGSASDKFRTQECTFPSLTGVGKAYSITLDQYDFGTEEASDWKAVKKITTAEELQAINENLDGNYVLMNNITLEAGENNFTAIGTYNAPFTGKFIGNGHTVSGINIKNSSEYQGLFGCSNGLICDVGVINSSITGLKYVGGVCGQNDGTISGSYYTGSVSGTDEVIGGVCGLNRGTISGSYNTGSVDGSNERYNVGGVCGQNYGTISNCYNTGSVRGNEYVGGVCGKNFSGTISVCYNTGSVGGNGYVGGVCGAKEVGTVENCYYNKNIFSNDNGLGTGKNIWELCGELSALQFDGTVWEKGSCNVSAVDSEGYKTVTYTMPHLKSFDTEAASGTVKLYNIGDTEEIWVPCTLIYTAEQLQAINENLGGSYILKNDITIADGENNFTPIGSDSTCFTGYFDGNGHTVSGININNAYKRYLGLFGYSTGTIKNVGVINSNINGSDCVGGVCGQNKGTISGCYFTGSLSAQNPQIGGICGYNNYGTISGCYNAGSVNSTGYSLQVGGVCGYSNSGTVMDCFNTGSVTATASSGQFVGGVCGLSAGGTLSGCYSVGSVTAASNIKNVGGVCGDIYGNNPAVNCSYNKDFCEYGGVNGADTTGAIGLTTLQMTSSNALTAMNLSSSVWNKTANDKTASMAYYPALNSFEYTPSTAYTTKLDFMLSDSCDPTNGGALSFDVSALVKFDGMEDYAADEAALTSGKGAFTIALDGSTVVANTDISDNTVVTAVSNDINGAVMGKTFILTYDGTNSEFLPNSKSVELELGKLTLTTDDFTFTAPSELAYDGNEKTASVTSKVEGSGTVTVKYFDDEGNEVQPIECGKYIVKIDVTEGTAYKKAEALTSNEWTFTITPGIPTVKDPTATAISYGQALSKSILSGTSWSWVDGTVIPTVENNGYAATTTVDDINYDYTNINGYNSNTHTITRTIAVTVDKAVPTITVMATPTSDIAGKTVTVSAEAVNPNNSTLTDVPAPALTYKVGSNGIETEFTGSFVIPEGTANNTIITITATTVGNGSYEAGTNTATVTVTDCLHTDKTEVWEKDNTGHWHICNYCGAIVDKEEHIEDSGTVTVEPTETTEGEKTYRCEKCGYVIRTETITKLSHTHSLAEDYSSDATGHWFDCSGCDEKVGFEAHDFDEGEITTPATEETEGVRTYTCKDCGYEKTEPMAKLDHTHKTSEEYSKDESGHWHACSGCEEKVGFESHKYDEGKVTTPATEETEGVKTFTCTVCGYTKTETIPVLDPSNSDEPDVPDDPAEKVNSFVERLYQNVLGRPSDPSKESHIDNLNNGETATKVAYDFVFSPEFTELDISNAERVTIMYNTFLNRDPDPAGLETWTKALDNGCSIGHIFYGFTQSGEFGEICDEYGIEQGTWEYTENRDKSAELTSFVSRLYTKALGRKFDVNGLNDHTGNYLENHDLYQMAYNFIFSQEFIEKNLSDEDFVDTMYRTFFDREPDVAGKADWLDRMANQGYTREDVLAGFVGSQECINLVARFGI